jgi:hypothetical protein
MASLYKYGVKAGNANPEVLIKSLKIKGTSTT